MSEYDYLQPDHRCCTFVGEFLQHWAFMEAELRDTLQKALGLNNIQGYTLASNIQLRDKISILRTAAYLSVGGDDDERRQNDKTLSAIADYATANRNMMAHDMFGPAEDGKNVVFFVVKAKGKLVFPNTVWTETDFENAHKEIDGFTAFLKELRKKIDRTKVAQALTASPPTGGLLGLTLADLPHHHSPSTPDLDADLANPEIGSGNPPPEMV
jgi:hypothetical protein